MSKELNEYLGIRDAMAASDTTCKHCDSAEGTPKRRADPVGYLYHDEYYCRDCIVDVLAPGASQDERDDHAGFLNWFAWICRVDRSRPASFSQRDFPHTNHQRAA